MTAEQRKLMGAHLAGHTSSSGGGASSSQRLPGEDPRAYGAPDAAEAQAAFPTSALDEPESGTPVSAAGREGGSGGHAGAQAPIATPPVDDE